MRRAVAAVQRARGDDLEHPPVPSETVQWVRDVIGMFGPGAEGTPDQLSDTLPAVCKSAGDEDRFLSAVAAAEGETRSRFGRGEP